MCVSCHFPYHSAAHFASSASQDFWNDDVQKVIKQLSSRPELAMDVLSKAIMENKAVKLEAWCHRHGKQCKLQTAKRHLAGTICIAFSRRGSGLGVSDPTILPTLSWCALRRRCQEASVIQENVRGCPVSLFAKYLADLYYIDVPRLCFTSDFFALTKGEIQSSLLNSRFTGS